MVRLDGDGRAAGHRHALDHVGVQRTLSEEGRALDLFGFGLEHVDEQAADGLALGLRVADPVERTEEGLARVHVHQRDVVGIAEQGHHVLGLVLPQQAMIDKNAGETVADGFVDQDGGNRGIDPA